MAAYTKQTWDTTSIFNPTRMNHIEQGIYDASTNIVDNLTSTDATSSLSAKQGKVIKDSLEWSEEIIIDDTLAWGTLKGIVNKGEKIACLRWVGNGTTATAGTQSFSLPNDFRPCLAMFQPMYNADSMEVASDSCTIRFTANNWSAGSITYGIW